MSITSPVTSETTDDSVRGRIIEKEQLLLDPYEHPNAAVALSLRKLRSGFGSEGAAGPDLSLTNNGVTPAALVGSRSGDYTKSNREYHRTTGLSYSGGDVYMSAFVKLSGLGDYQTVASTRGGSAVNVEGIVLVRNSIDQLEAIVDNGNTIAKTAVSNNCTSITFVELVYQSGILEVRADDALSSSVSVSPPSSQSYPFAVSASRGGVVAANGLIDNVVLEIAPQGELNLPSRSTELYNGGEGRSVQWYKDNLDLSHVQFLAGYENYTAGSDLTNDYPDNSGITDLAANSDDGTGPQVSGGKVGNAGVFDGTSNLQGGADEEFQISSDPFTITSWVYVDDGSTNRELASTWSGAGWALQYESGNGFRVFFEDGSATFNQITHSNKLTKQWVYVVYKFDGSTAELLVNNSSIGTKTISSIPSSGANFYVGQRPDGSFQHDGKIASLRVWNGRALTSSEISTLYNSSGGLSLSQIESDHPALLDDLVASYEFENSNDLGNDSFVLDGPVVRVRRASDNVEREIGFDGDTVDETALTDFANGGDVYVVRWYDQSGNGEHKDQITLADQPKLVSSGSLLTLNGRPYMKAGGLDSADQTFGTDNATDVEVNSVLHVENNGLSANKTRFLSVNAGANTSSGQGIRETSSSEIDVEQVGVSDSSSLTVDDGSVHTICLQIDGQAHPNLYYDDMSTIARSTSTSPDGTGGNTGVGILAQPLNVGVWVGKLIEYIFYPDVSQSRREAISDDQESYYSP